MHQRFQKLLDNVSPHLIKENLHTFIVCFNIFVSLALQYVLSILLLALCCC